MLTTLKNRMRGVSLTETLIMMPVFLMLTLGALQYALIYEAKSSLDYATFMSARAGAVDHARTKSITTGLAKSLAPLYSPDVGKPDQLLAAIAKAGLDIGLYSQIKILNPTKEAFKDFGVKNTEKNILEIPNEMLHLASTKPGKKSKLNIQDANLLKVQVLYGYELKVPFVNSVISTVSSWFTRDPVKLSYLSQKRLPILATATVRMQSRAWENKWVTKRADVDKAVNEAGKPTEPLASLQRPWASGPTGQGNPTVNPGADTKPGGGQPGNSGDGSDTPTDNKPPEDKPSDGTADNNPDNKPDCENNADNSTGDSDRSEDQGFWGNLWDKVKDATTSVYNFIKGFWQGIKNQVGDIVDTVTQPADTAKGLYELAKAFIDDPQKTIEIIAKALGKDLMTLVECGSYDQGRILGEYVSPAFMLKLATKLAKFPNLARALDETKKDFGCASFAAGTSIWMSDGRVSIEGLKRTLVVISRSDVTFSDAPQEITDTFGRIAPHYYRLSTETEILSVTEEHPLWIQGKGWTPVKEIEKGDIVASANGDTLIRNNIRVEKPLRVYNFSVSKTPSYFVGRDGIWAHNAKAKYDCIDDLPIELTKSNLGEKLGSGGVKDVYKYGDDMAVGIVKDGKPGKWLDNEYNALKELDKLGIDAIKPVGHATIDGKKAIITEYFDGIGSKDPKSHKYLNEKSIKQLSEIKEQLRVKKVKVHDLQFLIGKDGSVKIYDPADIDLKTKPSKKNNDTIDDLINIASGNI